MSSVDVMPAERSGAEPPAIVNLDEGVASDPDLVGAKAANLARATAAGLPVLPGFVLTPAPTSALDAGVVPAELYDAWVALSGHGRRSLAVRSSSVLEDGAASSMAGRFTTVLDVVGWPAFLAAVGQVSASAATDGLTAPMAVLVQPMLDAQFGGVLFGIDPVSGRTDRRIVAAVADRPDRLVSGAAAGAHYELGRHGRRRSADAPLEGLRPRELRRLVALGTRAGRVFGGPQDIEWAIDRAGTIHLLQSRPVTTVAGAAVPRGPVLGPGPVAETLPGVLSPLEQDLWAGPLSEGFDAALALAGARSRRRLRRAPAVRVIEGQVVVDLGLFGEVRRSWWALMDPRPGARRLAAAWRVGRLRAAAPVLATDLLTRADQLLLDVPALADLDETALLGLIDRSRALLVALHGQEILAGLLLGGDPAEGVAGTAAGEAIAALAAGRAAGRTDDDIVAADPVVLALVPPRIGPAGPLPGLGPDPVAPPGSASARQAEPTQRELLRLRVRWTHELSARAAWRLGGLLARRGALTDPALMRQLRLDELAAVIGGAPAPVDLPERAEMPEPPPLPARFRLGANGQPIAVRGPKAGRGAGSGRARGVVAHAGADVPPGAVLVVRHLDPSLATVLPRLAGLVAETGSTLSHLAILAREAGVPVVVGVDDAVARFAPGTVLAVDGGTGDVRVLVTAGVEPRLREAR